MPGYAAEDPTFQPAMRLITALTNAEQAVVTTSFDHDYLAGLIVRLNIPDQYGMYQVDQLVGEIVEVPSSDTFTIDIDTRGYDAFVVPAPEPWYQNDYATVVPVGEENASLAQATRNVL